MKTAVLFIYSLLVIALIIFMMPACGQDVAEVSNGDEEGEEDKAADKEEKEMDYVLPRSLGAFKLGDEFKMPEDFEETDQAGQFMFNEKKGKTFAVKGFFTWQERGVPAFLVNTIDGRIYGIKQVTVADKEELTKQIIQFKEKYKDVLVAGRTAEESGRDFEWYRFDDDKTVIRLERDGDKLTTALSAFDLE